MNFSFLQVNNIQPLKDLIKVGSVFTNHSQEHSLSFSSNRFESNITSDWLNNMVKPIRVMILSNISTEKSGEQDKGMQFLTFSQTTNFRLFQTDRVCRRKF